MVSHWPSLCVSVFLFRGYNLNISGFSPNLVCALILWRSGLGFPMGKFCKFLTVCQPHDSGGLLLFHVFIYLVDLALLFHVELTRVQNKGHLQAKCSI